MTNKLYNLGDSWAWGFEDSFDIPYETTYADTVSYTHLTLPTKA